MLIQKIVICLLSVKVSKYLFKDLHGGHPFFVILRKTLSSSLFNSAMLEISTNLIFLSPFTSAIQGLKTFNLFFNKIFSPSNKMADTFQEETTIKSCLKTVLEISRNHVETLNGSNEIIRKIKDNTKIDLVVIAEDLKGDHKETILGLCAEKNIPVLKIENRKELASVAPFKVKKLGAIAIKNFMVETKESIFIKNSL
ncbi:RS12 [Hepatospora eriocheir]|uniref:RS12 n=2 Tax=Hepatospora eriocheir TaxID=1081669 RepID=A0A1X0QH70_9MICR|nr:RS12 [Hepatospora eriocheir]